MRRTNKKEMDMEESCSCCHETHDRHFYNKCTPGNGIYGLGLIGSAVFFISQATTFWQGVLGFLKALVWPALMAYEALKFLIK